MSWTFGAIAVALLCVHVYVAVAERSRTREVGAVPLVEKAVSHEHWEHIVRRSVENWDYESDYVDDTAHIVNVQEYYREIFNEEWRAYVDVSNDDVYSRMQAFIANRQNLGPHQKRIKGRYIVMFTPEASDYVLDRTIEVLKKANIESEQRLRATDITPFRYVQMGFTATLNSKTVEVMSKHPLLFTIEEDVALKRSDMFYYPHAMGTEEPSADISESVPWNLDRLDQRNGILDGQYLPGGTGANVDIYICDTGIHYSHEDLEGRAHYAGFDAIDHLTGSDLKGEDCHGHGTHCAGTAAGKTYGVAKKANLYSLRALDCTGTGAVSGIIMAMSHVLQQREENPNGRPAIISMSLGLETSETLNAAVKSTTKKGVTVVAASGNQAGDSCDYSPASAKVGIAVGATDKQDRVVYFSNTGECTDVFAPGEMITSASNGCDTCTKSLSGTSMACPHVTGFAAIQLGLEPQLTPEEVKERIINLSTKDAVTLNSVSPTLATRTPNRMLYVPQAREEYSDMSVASITNYNSGPR